MKKNVFKLWILVVFFLIAMFLNNYGIRVVLHVINPPPKKVERKMVLTGLEF